MQKLFLVTSFIIILALFKFSIAFATQPGESETTTSILRPHVLVNESVIRLGDLFTNTGIHEKTPIAYSPKPGKKAIFDARWLYRVAKANDINWKPLTAHVQTIVERESIIISRQEIENLILEGLSEHGLGTDISIELSNKFLRLHIPANMPSDLNIEDFVFQQRTKRFTAIINLPTGDRQAKRLRITGRAYRTVKIPVLKQRLAPDSIIKESDLTWIKARHHQIPQDTLLKTIDLVGLSPKRNLRGQVPIRSRDVQRPILVQKNNTVTIFHRLRNMTLTAKGKALDHGANGQVIRVINTRSNQTIEAEVTGYGRVVVHSPQFLAMNK